MRHHDQPVAQCSQHDVMAAAGEMLFDRSPGGIPCMSGGTIGLAEKGEAP